jgi:L-seryl-tRNA(Ser) seleniumtransferase
LVAQLRRHPLTRALRVDKTTIAGIQANLLHYLRGEAAQRIPIWRMIAASEAEIRGRAEALLNALGAAGRGCSLVPGRSPVGGGSLPEETLPPTLIALPGAGAAALAARLRAGQAPVVARIQDGRVVLDLRTVLPAQEGALARRLVEEL